MPEHLPMANHGHECWQPQKNYQPLTVQFCIWNPGDTDGEPQEACGKPGR